MSAGWAGGLAINANHRHRAPTITRAHAEELDRNDPLAAFRDQCLPTTDRVAYLVGNSHGRPLASITESWQRVRSPRRGTRWTSTGA